MQKTLLLRAAVLCAFLFTAAFTHAAEVLIFTGVYQGKDVYVKNPFASDGVGFCIFEVRVNGEITSDEINSSAFAIDLSLFNLELGQPVEIIIRTKENCAPKIVNPEAIAPQSTFELIALEASPRGQLKITTKNEQNPMLFTVEQFKWNKWVKVAEFDGGGGLKANTYLIEAPLHFGANTFRLVQKGHGNPRYSEKIEVPGRSDEVALLTTRVNQELEFSEVTAYEVFNAYGQLIDRGKSRVVDARAWRPGTFYVNFDRVTGTVVRKR